jgi:hypothetical protein
VSAERVIALCGLALVAACRSGIDASAAREYPCLDDAQCPAAMRCGLDQRCHLRDFPAPFACLSDGDCEAGWRCGLEQVCHSRDVAAAYACSADSDCELDWRCGLERTCHSRDVAAAYACAADSDCELGWRCGLDATCHARVPAPYPCASDADCEGGWRCGFEQRCLDASADALRPAALPALVVERLSPREPDGLPRLVSSGAVSFATLRGDTLTHVELTADAGYQRVSVSLAGHQVRALSSDGPATLVLDELGVLEVRHGALLERRDAGRGATRLRDGALLGNDFIDDLWLARSDGGRQVIYDQSSGADVVAAEEGLYTRSTAQPISLPGFSHARCATPDTQRAKRVRRGSFMAIESLDLASGETSLALAASWSPGCFGNTLAIERCMPCSPGSHLLDFFAAVQGIPVMRVICAAEDGGAPDDFLAVAELDGGCTRQPVASALHEPATFGTALDAYSAVATLHGGLYQLSDEARIPLTLDSPAVLFMRGGRLEAQRPRGTDWESYRFEEAAGLVSYSSFFRGVHAVVDGDLEWVAAAGNLFDLSAGASNRIGAVPQGATNLLRLSAADGGATVLFSDGDRLLTTDPADGGTVLRLVPEPYVPILSLTAVGPLDGYALTRNALYAFTVRDGRWRASAVRVPENDWLQVWADGARGRLGYANGEVYSLPSRVRLAPPLPGGQRAVRFATLCAATVALGTKGVYLLEADAWHKQPLDAALSPTLDHRLDDGSLVRHRDTLYLVTGFGAVVRLTPPGGCP